LTYVEGDVTVCKVSAAEVVSAPASTSLLNDLYDIADSHPPKLLLCLDNVRAMSSLCFGGLLEVQRRVQRGGGVFALCSPQPAVADVLRVLGAEFSEIYPSLDEAVQSLRSVRVVHQHLSANKALVLLADPDAECHARLHKALRGKGMFMLVARNYDELERNLRDQRPDAVVAATRFEKITGFEIARALKQKERSRDIPIILLAAVADEENEQQAKAAGAEACFVKHGRYENAITFFLSAYLAGKIGDVVAGEEEPPRGRS
jgi:anti-anti-sigma factor